MAVNVEIRQKKLFKKEITIPQIAELKGLSYGVSNENYVLIPNETGKYTILYDKEHIGRGFEVWTEDKNIFLRLPLPTTGSDIVLFYTLVESICEKLGVKEFIRDEEKVPVEYCNLYIQQDTDISRNALEDITKKIRSGESEQFFLFGAVNPVAIGVNEVNKIAGNMEYFEELMNHIQQMDIYYANPRFYRKQDGSIFGMYFIDEDLVTAIPYKPYILFESTDEIPSWYVGLPGGITVVYDTFIENAPKKDDFDDARFVTVLTENEVLEIADKYSVDIDSGEYVKKYYWGSSIDSGAWHSDKIPRLELPLEKIVGYNHLAVFLRWAGENGFLSGQLREAFPELEGIIKENREDLRNIIHTSPYFRGAIKTFHFSEEIRSFVKGFYVFNTQSEDGYPYCVDMNAEKYFGEKYDSPEFKDEAYLFVPYDEDYYKNLSAYIDRAWEKYKNQG